MGTVTWRDLVGTDYGPGMAEPVDLTHLRVPPICAACRSMKDLMIRGTGLGGEPPNKVPDFVGRGAVTAHNVGAAIDIFYHSTADTTRAFANALVELFIRHRGALGWGWMAYNRMAFTQGGIGVPDDPHLDHIHIDWVDSARTQRSKALASFTFNDGQGVKTKTVGNYGQDVAMTTNAAADSAVPASFAAAYEALCSGWATADKARFAAFARDDFEDVYVGRAAGADLSWLYGWWTVWDGNYYYYFFDHLGSVSYIKTPPTTRVAPAAPANKGTYRFDGKGNLIVTWNAFPGYAATVETFYNATDGATTMNALSNQYSPPVATKMK